LAALPKDGAGLALEREGQGEIVLYLKLKWSSLGSLLGFSFYENLTTINIKQEWQ
jgi:hypothetical protein